MAAADLYGQAETLLGACTAILGTRTPATAFVSPAEPIYDCCPLLAVHVTGLAEASTSPGGALDAGHRFRTARVNLVSYIVSIVRCDIEVASSSLPDVPAKQGVALETYTDVWVLWNGLYRMLADGLLFQNCGERFLDGAAPVDTSGGCVGWRIVIRVSLSGYDPLAAS